MALRSSIFISLSQFRFFIFLIYLAMASKPLTPQTPLINNICHRTTFVDFCRQALMSHPKSASSSANLQQLGIITSKLVSQNATASVKQTNQMIQQTGESSPVREMLTICHLAYMKVLASAMKMKALWVRREVAEAKVEARKGIETVGECRNAFRGHACPLESNNLILERLLRMAIIMSDAA